MNYWKYHGQWLLADWPNDTDNGTPMTKIRNPMYIKVSYPAWLPHHIRRVITPRRKLTVLEIVEALIDDADIEQPPIPKRDQWRTYVAECTRQGYTPAQVGSALQDMGDVQCIWHEEDHVIYMLDGVQRRNQHLVVPRWSRK